MASRLEDSPDPMTWGDDYRASVAGGHAIAEIAGGNIYLAMSLRNVGRGHRSAAGMAPAARDRSG